MIKAIIFDCFGVLVTEMVGALIESRKPSKAKVTEILDAAKAADNGLITRMQCRAIIAAAVGISLDELNTFFVEGEHRNVRLVKYVAELKKRGYKTALLSNVGKGGLAVRFSEDEFREWFDFVCESGSLGIAKPNPKIYEHVAHNLDIPPSECVMIDDKNDYCVGAEIAGMSSILFTNNDQLFKDLEALLERD